MMEEQFFSKGAEGKNLFKGIFLGLKIKKPRDVEARTWNRMWTELTTRLAMEPRTFDTDQGTLKMD